VVFWLIVAAVLSCATLALLAHDYLSGQKLILDLWDELLIARSDIRCLDDRWRANPNRSDVIVSLTSIPSRLSMIDDTLKSLLRQSRAPAEIRLYLPRTSKREQVPYRVPERLKRLKSIVIVEVEEDLGPATKFLPILGDVTPEQKVLIVDDDRIYPRRMVEVLDAAATERPRAAYGLGGTIVAMDLVDRPTTLKMNLLRIAPAQIRATRIAQPTEVDILMGCHGYLVRPQHFDLQRLSDYSQAPPEAYFADDIWISGRCLAPKYALPSGRVDFHPYRNVPAYDRSSLGWLNRTGRPEQWINTVVLKWFGPGPWKVRAGRIEARRSGTAGGPWRERRPRAAGQSP
jgi:hypothetical protein